MSELLIYPKLDHDEKKSVKLKINDIEKIKHLRIVEKWGYSELSDLFKVSKQTIRYHLDPLYRKKKLDMTIKRTRNKRLDSDFRTHENKMSNERVTQRKNNDVTYNLYHKNIQKRWNKKYPEYMTAYCNNWRKNKA